MRSTGGDDIERADAGRQAPALACRRRVFSASGGRVLFGAASATLAEFGAWVNRVWIHGSKDDAVAFQVWVKGTQDAARAQRRGMSGKKRSPSPTPSQLYLLD
ncbi:hypothetical protein [Accumulibacter sp.]|uniref:hypothetical protein n=1 Tax=Accumulibacter sp. TaxID=2053492 RepID=UPI0035B3D0F3